MCVCVHTLIKANTSKNHSKDVKSFDSALQGDHTGITFVAVCEILIELDNQASPTAYKMLCCFYSSQAATVNKK